MRPPSSTPLRSLAALALCSSLLVSGLLSGCSQIEDAATETAGNAACSVAQSAVDGIAGQVESIADDIGADPASAQRELSALRDTLATAEQGISGDAEARLAEAGDALGQLADQAQQAADGVEVDTSAIDRAKRSFSEAVADVRDLC